MISLWVWKYRPGLYFTYEELKHLIEKPDLAYIKGLYFTYEELKQTYPPSPRTSTCGFVLYL